MDAPTPVSCASPVESEAEPTQYFVSLADAERHLAHVTIRLPQAAGKVVLNMPVWNALYQVRNFAENVLDVRAQDLQGHPVLVLHTGTSEWQVEAPAGCIVIRYDVYLDVPGPFGASLNGDHGFFNWAMALMFLPELRGQPISLELLDVPTTWGVRDLHVLGAADPGKASHLRGVARNYDELVDSPAEAGVFQQASFEQDGAVYHIVVDGDRADYDMAAMQQTLEKITHTAVDWMRDRPYDDYTFLYHFPGHPSGGGMEHAYGTAINISAARLREDSSALAEVSAHEFFHLWNVKRIRPQSLEPIDYSHQQDSRALWFSEGVTSTVADMLLVRAGIASEQQYLANLGRAITELQQRPAHAWQSAEDSSLDAWFEGSPFYRTPARSISYYNKGEILGVLLDLRLREFTNGRKSLRDLFQRMNNDYAKQHKFFADSAGVMQAAEATLNGQPPPTTNAAPLQSLSDFFRDYVSGTQEIPYDKCFGFVGLQVISKSRDIATIGLTTTTNIGAQPEVVSVEAGSDAQKQGIARGDRLVAVDGKPATELAPRRDRADAARRHDYRLPWPIGRASMT